MSITREEAIKELERLLSHWDDLENGKRSFRWYSKDAVGLAITALRPVSREGVEKVWRGEWVKRHKHRGGFRRVKGFDDMGEQHEVTIGVLDPGTHRSSTGFGRGKRSREPVEMSWECGSPAAVLPNF